MIVLYWYRQKMIFKDGTLSDYMCKNTSGNTQFTYLDLVHNKP